jgi:hypothetical protein
MSLRTEAQECERRGSAVRNMTGICRRLNSAEEFLTGFVTNLHHPSLNHGQKEEQTGKCSINSVLKLVLTLVDHSSVVLVL